VNPAVKYTLARLGLFVAVLLLLLPIPNLDILLKLMIAVLVSAVLSWFLMRRMREEVAVRLQQSVERRREEKDKLRSALAGDNAPDSAGDMARDNAGDMARDNAGDMARDNAAEHKPEA
jgi:mannitol-specific phosphotransferase system IIBC component